MSKASKPRSLDKIVYPERDGKRMSDNTLQFRWIYTIETNLDAMLPNDFVAGALLWYPVEGNNKIRIAPDAMVCLGRPKGERGSYRQWEEDNVIPQVVFEILSPCNTKKEMEKKLAFYEHYGVQEYYLYDPDHNKLKGWQRGGDQLLEIVQMHNWISPILGIRFDMSGKELAIFGKAGERFLSPLEKHAYQKEIESLLEQERQKFEQERQQRAAEQMKMEQLMEQLKLMGIDTSKLG